MPRALGPSQGGKPMSKLILAAPAVAALCLAGCNYNKNYNNTAEYNATGNYAGNEAYGNATEYNATNETYANETANMGGNVANSANTVTNNSY
jgi:outer membrane murein-binding lipoprotein Lpp